MKQTRMVGFVWRAALAHAVLGVALLIVTPGQVSARCCQRTSACDASNPTTCAGKSDFVRFCGDPATCDQGLNACVGGTDPECQGPAPTATFTLTPVPTLTPGGPSTPTSTRTVVPPTPTRTTEGAPSPTRTLAAGETNCNDRIDNDGDNLTDCADPDCQGDPLCRAAAPLMSGRLLLVLGCAIVFLAMMALARRERAH